MTSNTTSIHSVEEWNRELTKLLIPNDIILCIYILLGVSGNSLVLYVYKFKFMGEICDRYFVPYLAMTDIMATIASSSMGLAVNTMQVTFANTTLCKIWWFFAAIATFSSGYTLLIIAVVRYRKVVTPDGKQMDLRMNRIILISALTFSVLCAAPTLLLYGSVPFPNADATLVGWRCGKIKSNYKVVSIVYGIFVGIILVSVIGSLIGMYAQIGRTIFLHIRYTKKMSKIGVEKSSSTKTTLIDDRSSDDTEIKTDAGNTNHQRSVTETDTSNTNHQRSITETTTTTRNDISEKFSTNQHKKINKRIRYKFTLMFMLITVIYLICYVPKVLIMLIEAIKPKYWDNFSNTGRAAMLFTYRMFIINNIANPFVYAFMDTKFQSELKKLCNRCNAK